MLLKPRITTAALLAALLAGCMTATPYQPEAAGQRVSGGYSEQRLGPDRYRVHFHGNSMASRDRVEGYMLYRAAELTVQNGYDWFVIVDRHTEHEVETYAVPDPFYRPWYGSRYGYWRPHWRYYRQGHGWTRWHPEVGGPFWTDRLDIRTVERFEADADIVMRRGPIAAGEDRAFDARRVMQDLGPSIERPRDGS
ncbi:hypothetical protein [Sphingosinicella sp. YJ22]|uniref:CC0125/CC1285 family lipoprotein n=1 Tax=Sphingosinicella sp. YJ22 TaxID=1104780 RepID=UPI00140E129C|nr:hypothetical protein [Sphingosinicella sp. YJ22]